MGEYSPAKTGEYPRIFPNFQNYMRCVKDLKDNKDNSLNLGRKYTQIFVLGQVWSEFGHPILCRSFCRVLHLYADTSSFPIFLVSPLSACYDLFGILPCFISPYKYVRCHGNPVCFSSQVLHII